MESGINYKLIELVFEGRYKFARYGLVCVKLNLHCVVNCEICMILRQLFVDFIFMICDSMFG